MINKERLIEWLKDPTTILLKSFFRKELLEIKNTPISDCLVCGEPQKTQENLVELETRERCWAEMVSMLEGNWDESMGEEDDTSK